MSAKAAIKQSRLRVTVETAFFGNNVVKVNTIGEAYALAAASPGTVVTDMPVHRPLELGLPSDAKVLLFNDGAVTGRCAQARRIIGQHGVCEDTMTAISRDAVYESRYKKLYHAQVVVGLSAEFMVKANLLVPAGHENILYNWMMNFQPLTEEIEKMYCGAERFDGEGEIFIFSDPDWKNADHPLGLTLFDPEKNCACLLGMKYFGEHKKGTLTLAWGIANRNDFASCHGGQKRYTLDDGRQFVAGIFGLSGSGKSTLTHYKHDDKYAVKVLHDDAFVISTEDGSSVALEPSYFDKTQDYPMGCEDNKYLVTAQNCGATRDEDGNCVLVTEDIRNGNGRAIKSKFWAPNRVNRFDESIDAIIWLMKDPCMPPMLKIEDPQLAATLGATLATKRSTAERLANGADPNALVIEPYANPFRTYPLKDDFTKFRTMFEKRGTACYILNTGHFDDKKIPKEVTLSCLESIVEGSGSFEDWCGLEDVKYMPVEGFEVSECGVYAKHVIEAFERRKAYLLDRENAQSEFDTLPKSAVEILQKQIDALRLREKFHKTA